MVSVEQSIRRAGGFLRRRDLLALGHQDRRIRAALGAKRVFRVRHGWYSLPDIDEDAIRAVRVGGRLTGTSALLSYGLRVPHSKHVHIAVAVGACRLRSPADRRARLSLGGRVRIHWVEARGPGCLLGTVHNGAEAPRATPPSARGAVWRVSVEDALLEVLRGHPRDIAVACCSAALRHGLLRVDRLDAVFRCAPRRVRCWRGLVSALDDAHGETFMRLWMLDNGIRYEAQSPVPGLGRRDFRVGPRTYLEVDGAQHDPAWTGEGDSDWPRDLDRMLTMAVGGGTVIRINYPLLYRARDRIRAAIERSVADDLAVDAYRRRHPYRPRRWRGPGS